jgi:hypothetical protein
VLATAGGLVFAGALDHISAYDDATGSVLWRSRRRRAERGRSSR